MASTILLKRSSTASSVPAAASLQAGELAVNLADQKLYSKTAGGTVVQVGFGNLTSTMVTSALGYTPYNATNPNGFITSSGSITGSSGSCTGNAATATTATNLSGGTVSGTTGTFTGSVTISSNNASGGGLILSDDGDIVDLNDGYASMRFSSGVRVYSGNKTGGAVITLSSSGSITATGDITAYSDARLKTDIETITGALDRLRKLRGVTFTRRDTGSRGIGLVAQELAPIVPEAVMAHDDGLLSVAYGNLVGVLIEAVKDLADKVERLEAQA